MAADNLNKAADKVVKKRKCILRDILQERELTQSKMADISGVPQSIISAMCRNAIKRVNIDYLFAIAESLNTSIEELYEEDLKS